MASSTRDLDPHRLDVGAFAAAGGELAGDWPADRLTRLVATTLAPEDGSARSPIGWRASGKRRALAGAGLQPSLSLGADTDVTLECQRCLQPMQVPLHAERRIFFVDGEEAAAALDAECDDDVLALTPALDLANLVEDDPALDPADNPFAVLAALKRGPRPN